VEARKGPGGQAPATFRRACDGACPGRVAKNKGALGAELLGLAKSELCAICKLDRLALGEPAPLGGTTTAHAGGIRAEARQSHARTLEQHLSV